MTGAVPSERRRDAAPAGSALRRLTRTILSYVPATLAGLLIGLSFIEPALGWSAWLAVVLLAVGVKHPRAGGSFLRGWCAGFAMHIVAGYWLAATISEFARYGVVLSWCVVGLQCALAGLQFAVFGYLTNRLAAGLKVLIYPIAWVACEEFWPSLFPWRLGASQYGWMPFIQFAEFSGVCGLSFLMMWCGALLGEAARLLTGARATRGLRRHLVGCGAVMAATLSFGWWRIGDIERYLSEQPELRVGLVQPSHRPWLKSCQQLSGPIERNVDLLCWPESAVPHSYPLSQERVDSPPPGLSSVRPYPNPSAYVLFGATSHGPGPRKSRPHFVSALLVDPGERVVGRYHKRTLVPFGEYIPGERWFPSLHRFSPFELRFRPGRSAEPLVIPGRAKLGVLICYEDIVPSMARQSVLRGADLLINLTNDMWFGNSAALVEHMRLAQFRAIENRRYLLRSTTTGISAVISPTGRLLARTAPDEATVLTPTVHTSNIRTLYSRCGQTLGWLCCAVLAFLAVLRIRARLRPPDEGTQARSQ